MAIFAVQAAFGVLCPLTILENWLRDQAGQVGYFGVKDEELSFVGRLARDILFVDPEVLTVEELSKWYYGFLVIVVVCLVFVRPSRPFRRVPGDPRGAGAEAEGLGLRALPTRHPTRLRRRR